MLQNAIKITVAPLNLRKELVKCDIRDSKMEEAKNMLLNLNLPVKEVSDMVGYKNPQHFSTAFKRKFGVSPSVLLKK